MEDKCLFCGDIIPEGRQVCGNCEKVVNIHMNNKTIKKINITIKLRGDNVYDLYVDDELLASRGSYDGIVDEVKKAMKKSLIE